MARLFASTLLILAVVLVCESSAVPVRAGWRVSCDDPCCTDHETCGNLCGCDCSPLWTVRAEAVALHRDRSSGGVLFENVFQPDENLQGSDFNFGYQAGFDVSLIRRLDCLPDLEVRYLKDDGWNSETMLTTNGSEPLRINTATPIFVPRGGTIEATNTSQLDNLEFNFRCTRDWVTWLAGFRYLEIDELFRAEITNPSLLPVTYDTTTQNRLYGLQLGVEALLWQRGRFCVDAVAKGAIAYNSGRQDSTLGTTAFQMPATGSADQVSLLGEARLTAGYALTQNLSIRGGYGFLAVDGLVLATEQVHATDFALGTGVDDNGSVFYHGAFLGLEYLH